MSVAKAGLPPSAVDDFESCQALLLRIWNTYEPGVERPSNQVTPEDKSRAVAAAMQAKFKSQMSRILGERLSGEGILRGHIYERHGVCCITLSINRIVNFESHFVEPVMRAPFAFCRKAV